MTQPDPEQAIMDALLTAKIMRVCAMLALTCRLPADIENWYQDMALEAHDEAKRLQALRGTIH